MPIELNLHPPAFSRDVPQLLPRQDILSETDWKTYGLVAMSYLLIGIGLALAGSVLFMATIVHPMLAVASPAVPIVLGILGLSSRNPSEMLFAGPTHVWEKEQPLGLKNMGANCWINAAFQMCVFKFYDLLKEVELKFSSGNAKAKEVGHFTKIYPLILAVERYRKELVSNGAQDGCSSVDTQKIRQWLAIIYDDVPKEPYEQWDAMVFFDALLGGIDYTLPLMRKTDRTYANGVLEKGEESPCSAHCLVLNLKKGGDNRFNTLLNECFEESFDGTVGITSIKDPTILRDAQKAGVTEVTAKHRVQTWFSEAPASLLFQARRFNKDFDKNGKVVSEDEKLTDAIDFPMELTLGKNHCPSPQQPTYVPDAFIMHRGSINGGHYFGYIRREDGKWFEVNDSRTKEVDVSVIKKELPEAYLVHYSKRP